MVELLWCSVHMFGGDNGTVSVVLVCTCLGVLYTYWQQRA